MTRFWDRLPFFLLLLAGSGAWATSFYPRPFPQVVQSAPVIVRGTTGAGYGDWGIGADGTRRIYTYYDLAIDEVFKGDVKGSSLVMREIGGEKDGIGMEVAGAAHFSSGENVVVTLAAKNPDGSYDVRGLMTGKFGVKRDADGTEYLTGAIYSVAGDPTVRGKWTLDALRNLIAAQIVPGGQPSSAASPAAAPSPAPRLQPAPSRGASESPVSRPKIRSKPSHRPGWIRWGVWALALGALGIWAITRRRE